MSRSGSRLHVAALAAVAALALVLRAWKLGHGLPDFLDEALPFRWALGMWSDPEKPLDWNPHRFHHPSLATYLHLFVQQAAYHAGRGSGAYLGPADYHLGFLTDPTSMALAARWVGVAADLATVLLVARIGERIRRGAGFLAALIVACSPAFITAARSITSDSVMVPLAMAAVERTLVWRERGGTGRLAAAAAFIGLAAGAKYPAAILLAPLAVALFLRGGARALTLWPLAAGIAAAAFLVTTPFAVLDFATFQRDLGFVQALAQKGHLGNLVAIAFPFHMRNLARDLSWVGVALLPASLLWTATRARERGDVLILWAAFLAFGVPIAIARVEAERYLLPVLPLAAVIVAEIAFAAAGRLPLRWRRAGGATVALILAVPAIAGGIRAATAGGGETRIEARRWCEANLTSRDLLVQEHYAAPLLERMEWLTTRSGPVYRLARPEARSRYDARRWFSSVTLPLAVVGSSASRVQPPAGPPVDLEVFPHVADFNQAAYDPRLFQRVDWFATSGATRGRFAADPARYAAQVRFYALLDSAAEVAARFAPHGASGGPEIVFYRLGPRAQQALGAFGPLDTLWWAESIPRDYRERAERLLMPPLPSGGAVRTADGAPTEWVASLRPVYGYQFSAFALAMGMELADRARYAEARRFAAATLAMAPEDAQVCVLYVACCAGLREWGAARAAAERTLRALDAAGVASPTLRLHYGEVLANLGERAAARREFEGVAAVGGEIGEEARRRIEQLR